MGGSVSSGGMCNYCHRHEVSNGSQYCSSLCATQDRKCSSYASRSPTSLANLKSSTSVFSRIWRLFLTRSHSAPAKLDGLKVHQSPSHDVSGVRGQNVKNGKPCNDDDEERSVSRPAKFIVDLHVKSPSSPQPHKKLLSNPLKSERSQCATIWSKEVSSETEVEINKINTHHDSESPLTANRVSIKHIYIDPKLDEGVW